jgi:hypothetical protein
VEVKMLRILVPPQIREHAAGAVVAGDLLGDLTDDGDDLVQQASSAAPRSISDGTWTLGTTTM